MTFWVIVLGIIAVVLLLAWRADRRGTGRNKRIRVSDSPGLRNARAQARANLFNRRM